MSFTAPFALPSNLPDLVECGADKEASSRKELCAHSSLGYQSYSLLKLHSREPG
jgi:hypothetical protein